MALSNWDMTALGFNGSSVEPLLDIDGFHIDIYKHWLHIEKQEETPMAFYDGKLFLQKESHGITIHGLQKDDAGFFLVEYWDNEKEETSYWAGMGCYAYDDNVPRIIEYLKNRGEDVPDSVSSEHICVGSTHTTDDYGKRLSYHTLDFFGENYSSQNNFTISEEDWEAYGLESKAVGITPETYQEFLDWLESFSDSKEIYGFDYQSWLKKAKHAQPYRCNQGDRYLIGYEASFSELGKAEENTVFLNLVSDMSDEMVDNIIGGDD